MLFRSIKRFQKSVRYKRSEDKEAALKKFKITFQKQRLWNEVLKIEKNADAQLGRSFEFALPKEWSRQEQIQYTTCLLYTSFFRVPRFMDHVLAFALLCCERCTGNNVPDIKVIIQKDVYKRQLMNIITERGRFRSQQV